MPLIYIITPHAISQQRFTRYAHDTLGYIINIISNP